MKILVHAPWILCFFAHNLDERIFRHEAVATLGEKMYLESKNIEAQKKNEQPKTKQKCNNRTLPNIFRLWALP